MKVSGRKVVVGLVLFGLAAAVILGLQAAGMGSPAGDTAPTEWEELEETVTPLPTLAFEGEPSPPGALLATAVLMLCSMVGMLVVGVFAAIGMVRLREKILKR